MSLLSWAVLSSFIIAAILLWVKDDAGFVLIYSVIYNSVEGIQQVGVRKVPTIIIYLCTWLRPNLHIYCTVYCVVEKYLWFIYWFSVSIFTVGRDHASFTNTVRLCISYCNRYEATVCPTWCLAADPQLCSAADYQPTSWQILQLFPTVKKQLLLAD